LAVRPEHNPILGKHMFQSILDALSAAYTIIVGILIDTEKKL
jgi:hemoglobin-like flavoprotein